VAIGRRALSVSDFRASVMVGLRLNDVCSGLAASSTWQHSKCGYILNTPAQELYVISVILGTIPS
jgi:hypothetical protein